MNQPPIDPGEVRELDLTTDAVAEAKHLQKNFGRRDILLFTICTLVGVDTIAMIAAEGAQAFTWLAILGVVFFFPSALAFAELGTAFPQEGGPYLWARLAFGRLPAAINNFLYWVTNPVWMGGSLALTAAATVETFYLDGRPLSTVGFYAVTLSFIWIGMISAILSFKVGKWIPITGAYARFVLLGLFTVSTVIYAFKHGVHGVHVASFGVSFAGIVALVGVLMFNYVGFENPNSAGDEMKDPQRDVPYALGRGAVSAFLLYSLPVLGILVVLPTEQVTGLGGFIDAIKAVFSVYGGTVTEGGTTLTGFGAVIGDVVAFLFVLCLLSSGTAWIMGSDRALAVSGYDGAAPRWLGVISEKHGTPVRANVLSGLVAMATLIATRVLSGGDTGKYFGAVLNIAVSTTLLSYLAIFPALWRLRVTHPNHPRPYRAPAARLLSVWLTACIAFAAVEIVAPGIGVDWFGGDFTPEGWTKAERWTYLLTELVPLVVFLGCGVLFWAVGARTRAHRAAAAGGAS